MNKINMVLYMRKLLKYIHLLLVVVYLYYLFIIKLFNSDNLW